MIECGIGTNNPNIPSSMGIKGKPGASLRMWRDFFPNATVIGVDIDKNILFSETRIQTFQCDQTDKLSISQFIINANLKKMTGTLDWDGVEAEFDEIYGHKLVFRNSVTYYAFNKITLDIKSSSFLFLCTKVNDL